MTAADLRRDYISKPIFRLAQRVLPHLSATEREAIEAGDVWWDGELFSGNPDWAKLLSFAPAKLTADEQAFLDGPVEELCHMLDDWRITWELRDLSPEVWDYLKRRKFFAKNFAKKMDCRAKPGNDGATPKRPCGRPLGNATDRCAKITAIAFHCYYQ